MTASIAYYARLVGQAERYYREQQDHVLGADQEVGESATLVYGADAVLESLGLQDGEVDSPVVAALARGCHPSTGEILVRGRAGLDPSTGEPWHRRCYYDFALSVPQSYSTAFAAALAAGDTAMASALREDLIDAAIDSYRAMEDIVPMGRRGVGGFQKVSAQAPFLANLHSTSRPVSGRTHGDPTLHVHLRVMNMALGDDGQWGAVDYRPLWSGVRTWSAMFEAELQTRVLRRGGQTTVVERGSRNPWASWELAGRNRALDEAFSTRSTVVAAVEVNLWQRNANELLVRIQSDDIAAGESPRSGLTGRQWEAIRPTAKQIDAEVRRTREKKGPTSRGELLQEWRERIEEHRYEQRPYDGVDRRFGMGDHVPARLRMRLAARARDAAIEQLAADLLAPTGLTASRVVWTRPELAEAVSAALVPAQLGVDDAVEVMRRVESRAVAAPVRAGTTPMWTTAELLGQEREWTSYLTGLAARPDRLRVAPAHIEVAIAHEAGRARRAGRGEGLDAEQRAAVAASLEGPGFTAIVGDAGAGKTTTARVLAEALELAGYAPIGLAMSGSASQALADAAILRCWNVRDFLTRRAHRALLHEVGPRTVVLLDEAGTIDDRTLAELTRVLRSIGVAGVIALGDDQQTQPVGAGAPLAWLRRSLPERVSRLTVNYRQGEDRGDTRAERSQLLRQGDGKAYLEALDRNGRLVVTRTTDDAVTQLTVRWRDAIAGGGDVRDHIGVCNLVDSRDQLNEAFRSAYARLGRLGDSVLLPGGRPLAIGDRVAFNAPFREVALDAAGAPIPHRTRRGRVIPGRMETTGCRALNRARATVDAFDVTRGAVQVTTDAMPDRPRQTMLLRGVDADRVLDYGYCLTTNISQGATVAATYSLGDVSRITGASNSYVQATRDSRDHWLSVSAESAHVDPLEDGWRARTMASLAAAMSRQQRVPCALDYFDAPPADSGRADAVGSGDDREVQRRERALQILMSPATQEQLDQLAGLGHSPDETRHWTALRALAAFEARAGVEPGTTMREWLACTHGEDRAQRWVEEAMLACGAVSPVPAARAARPVATPEAAALSALSMPATAAQMDELAQLDRRPVEGGRWTWSRASVERDLARGGAFPGRDVIEWLSANSVSPAVKWRETVT